MCKMKNVIIRPVTFNLIVIINNYHHGQFGIKHRPQSNPRRPLAPLIRKCCVQRLNEPHAGLATTSCPSTCCPCNGRPRAQDQPTRKVQRNTPQILRLCQCRNPSFGLVTKAKGLQGCEPRGSPGVILGVQESVREGTLTLPRQLPLWEMESRWTPKTSESDLRGQNSMACGVFYIIGKLLKR